MPAVCRRNLNLILSNSPGVDMAMNREQKRAMQKAGQLGEDGAPVTTRERRQPPVPKTADERTSPVQFVREVRAELKKVSWPTRAETLRFSLIVFIAILVLGTFIFLIDLGFAQVTDFLFPAPSSSASALSQVPSL